MPTALVPAAFAGASVLVFAAAVQTRRSRAIRRFPWMDHIPGPQGASPLHLRGLSWLGGRRSLRRLAGEATLRQRLVLAGHRRDIDVFLGIKAVLATATGALTAILSRFSPATLVMLPVALAAGFRAPDVLLARRAQRRQEAVAGHVADLVEVLVATTEAGLSPAVALRRSVEVMRGPLGEELTVVVREIDLGTPWREALARLLERTDAPPLRRLVATLTRSQRLGASVGATLRSLAEDVRAERRARAEEVARRAPVKMLFPLVFLILPAFLLLTVGPAVLATLRSLH